MDDVITQLGLLLTQTRFARRALEDIERTTAQYSLSAITAFGSGSAGFGSPPLLDGALRVYVVNIADLAPGGGFGDALAGLLGGVGSFVGNLFGGFVGGTAGSVWLATSIGTLATLAERIERIIDKLGLGKSAAQAVPAAGAAPPPAGQPPPLPAAAGGQRDLLAMFSTLQGSLDAMAALLRAANGEFAPGAPPGAPAPTGAPADADRWRGLADSLTTALDAATRLVGGLIVAVPTAIAAFSWLLDRLPDVRNAIIDTLRFAVRNVLLLRGAVVVLALETMAMVARVAALAVRALAATVTEALAALFAALARLLDGALQLVGVLGDAVVKTVDALLNWLVPAVDKILIHLGTLRVFRLLERLIDVLPLLLALKGLPKADGSAAHPADPGRAALTAPVAPPPPDLAKIMAEASTSAQAAAKKIGDAGSDLVNKPTTALRDGLTTFAEKLDRAAIEEAARSDRTLADRLETLGAQASKTAELLTPVAPVPTGTSFAPIAAAYGQWLAAGGLGQLLSSMQTYFTSPQAGPDFAKRTGPEASAAVVQIDEVVIDIAPGTPPPEPEPPQTPWGPGDFPLRRDDDLDRIATRERIDAIRGSRLRPRPHVPIFD